MENQPNEIELNKINLTEIQENTNLSHPLESINSLINSDILFTDLLNKYKIDINLETKNKIINILKYLASNTSDSSNIPLNTIINEILIIFQDGKLDIHDIPIIIKILNECLSKNIKQGIISGLNVNNFGILIKIIIVGLIQTNVININGNDEDTILKLIDLSILLLNTVLELDDVKTKCKCF